MHNKQTMPLSQSAMMNIPSVLRQCTVGYSTKDYIGQRCSDLHVIVTYSTALLLSLLSCMYLHVYVLALNGSACMRWLLHECCVVTVSREMEGAHEVRGRGMRMRWITAD